ncbi:MAG: hypothetical protein JEZ04_07380 [Spirochaetales bacterium]|nr:hypothetical protein [Spirochaetales bacterium]
MKNNTNKFGKLFIGVLLISSLVVLSSCSVKNEITLGADGSGSASMTAKIDEMLVTYLSSLAELTGDAPADGVLFNVDDIRKGIEDNPGLRVKAIKNDADKLITAVVEFDDIEALILQSEENLGNEKIISFKKSEASKEIRIYIDIDNFLDIAPLFPMVEEPLFMTFGPLENQGLAEDDYLEMMEYALGDGGGKLIKESMITTIINIDGKLISQTGGRVSGKNSVTFETPLIRLLLLDKPIEYSIKFE